MSRALVSLDQIIRVNLAQDHTNIGFGVKVDFSRRLQTRGTDFVVHANSGYTESSEDDDILIAIMGSLMNPDFPVKSIKVEPFTLEIFPNTTLETREVISALIYALDQIGYHVVYKDLTQR